MAAQMALFARPLAGLPSWAGWVAALAGAVVGGLGLDAAHVPTYVALVAVFLLLSDRFAHTWSGVSAVLLRDGGATPLRTASATMLADPVAREFARARRAESPLTVVSITPTDARRDRRALARVGRALEPKLRRTDILVHALNGRLVLILPDADHGTARALLERTFGDGPGLMIGTATFPEDGVSWEGLRDVAIAREQEPRPDQLASVGASRSG